MGRSREEMAITKWVCEKRLRSFSERDVKRARAWMEPDKLARALVSLTNQNAIRPRSDSASGRPARGGRPPSSPSTRLTRHS